MSKKAETSKDKQEYTNKEFREKFTPQRKAQNYEQELTRASFMEALERVSLPLPKKHDKGTSETSE